MEHVMRVEQMRKAILEGLKPDVFAKPLFSFLGGHQMPPPPHPGFYPPGMNYGPPRMPPGPPMHHPMMGMGPPHRGRGRGRGLLGKSCQ